MWITEEQKEAGFIDPNKSKIAILNFCIYGALWLGILAVGVWAIGYVVGLDFLPISYVLGFGCFVCFVLEGNLAKNWKLHWQT